MHFKLQLLQKINRIKEVILQQSAHYTGSLLKFKIFYKILGIQHIIIQ